MTDSNHDIPKRLIIKSQLNSLIASVLLVFAVTVIVFTFRKLFEGYETKILISTPVLCALYYFFRFGKFYSGLKRLNTKKRQACFYFIESDQGLVSSICYLRLNTSTPVTPEKIRIDHDVVLEMQGGWSGLSHMDEVGSGFVYNFSESHLCITDLKNHLIFAKKPLQVDMLPEMI